MDKVADSQSVWHWKAFWLVPTGGDSKAAKPLENQRGVRYLAKESDLFMMRPATLTGAPPGQNLRRYQKRTYKPAWEYKAPRSVCAQCPLREQCTTSKTGRRIHRFERQEVLDLMRCPNLQSSGQKIAGAGNTSWKEVSPMPPIAVASNDRRWHDWQ